MNSYWIESSKTIENLKTLKEDRQVDVCIIGGGMFGITTAYYLSKQGYQVAVLEKANIGEQTTGHTTAKITSQHGLQYSYLLKSYGEEFAKKYLRANQEAIANIRKIVEEEQIACDLETKNHYVYTTRKTEIKQLENEIRALETLGFKEATFKENLSEKEELPFPIQATVEFENQAQFHPLKYLEGLCNRILKNKGEIYTGTLGYDIKKEKDYYKTYVRNEEGEEHIVHSSYVVIATHYPFLNFPGFYFTKMYQSSSYVIGIQTEQKIPSQMYINVKDPIYSFRTAKDAKGAEILLIGGAEHKTGKNVDNEETYGKLEKFVKKYYPDNKILYRWNTRDCITLDKIPYIGEFSAFMPGVFVGTGFNKWGMTSSNVAANIITNKIMKKEDEYEAVFNATRLHPIKNRGEMKNILVQSTKSLLTDKVKDKKVVPEDIDIDTGGIVEIEGEKVGIYKSKEGKVYKVKPICTHLGCLLEWNNVDKTWDCPCHGSRFDYTGKNLYDPAIKDLEILP